jgi:hypothetical protein
MDICNSWYLYNLECYWTSFNNCNGHLMLYTISYIQCKSHAIICNFFVINLCVRFPHTFQCDEWDANVTFDPFVDKSHIATWAKHIYKIIFTFASKKATRWHFQFGKHEQNTYTRLYLHLQARRLQEDIFNLENMSKAHIQDYIYICKQEGYEKTFSIWKTWTNHTRHVL